MTAHDRPLVVAFFLALLELIRRAQVRAWQEAAFGPIWLGRKGAAAGLWRARSRCERRAPRSWLRWMRSCLKAVLESLLLAAGEPVSLARLAAVLEPVPKGGDSRKALADLKSASTAKDAG